MVDGCADYQDALGTNRKVAAGDVIFVLPGLPHRYGPEPKGHWSEFFVVFGGTVFETFFRSLLDQNSLIYRVYDLQQILELFEKQRTADAYVMESRAAEVVTRLLAELTTIVVARPVPMENTEDPGWLQQAKFLIDQRIAQPTKMSDVAAELGVDYDIFRKAFRKAVGVSPSQYHLKKRIEAACSLLRHTKMTNRQIAENLGFCDEYHFSSRFQSHTGLRPGVYRRSEAMV